MKKGTDQLKRVASTIGALSMLLGCGGSLSVGADKEAGGYSGQTVASFSGSGGSVSDSFNSSGGDISTFGGAPIIGGGGDAGSGGHDFSGTMTFAPGVECTCDVPGDSVCSGSVQALCAVIPGCKPALADVKLADICINDPFYAEYAAGTRTVISYGIGSNNSYQMIYDTASGDLVGGFLSGNVGLACNLTGKTEFAEGVQVSGVAPTCRLCSATAAGAAGAAGDAGIPSCPAGTLQ